MGSARLTGRSILVVEDQPLIAWGIQEELASAGASVEIARSVSVALPLVARGNVSAAVVDFGLGDDDAGALCARLKTGGIPFIVHSGYQHGCETYGAAAVIPKPALPGALAEALAE